MKRECSVSVIIPALNEEDAIVEVLNHLPLPMECVTVADNGSTDRTAERARAAGARVIHEPRNGYGRACLAGIRENLKSDVVVFLDGDFSDDPKEITQLIDPIECDQADFVLGARFGPGRPWHARFGTRIYVAAINFIWGASYRDLGPFRAIRRSSLELLGMSDLTWGWTIEMQVKAIEAGLRIHEIPVSYRVRIGESKISGSVIGSIRAATRMFIMIIKLWGTRRRRIRECGWPLHQNSVASVIIE
jgi:glycosyltransferase involved in cell wall biosynthesis